MANKPYNLMTPAERTADRIAKNKAIDAKVAPVLKAQASGKSLAGALEARRLARGLDKAVGIPEFMMKSFDEVINMDAAEFRRDIFALLKGGK
jgi:hypothetical protein